MPVRYQPAVVHCCLTHPTKYHMSALQEASRTVCSRMFIAFLERMAPASSCTENGKFGRAGRGTSVNAASPRLPPYRNNDNGEARSCESRMPWLRDCCCCQGYGTLGALCEIDHGRPSKLCRPEPRHTAADSQMLITGDFDYICNMSCCARCLGVTADCRRGMPSEVRVWRKWRWRHMALATLALGIAHHITTTIKLTSLATCARVARKPIKPGFFTAAPSLTIAKPPCIRNTSAPP